MQFQFAPATKPGSKARIALLGGPGSGKTWTALEIAKGLDAAGGSVGLIDTERRSARKYADMFKFDWLGFSKFDPTDLTRATIAAATQNVGILVVDTWTPFWSGDDGMLDKVGAAATNHEGWRAMRPIERQMVDALFGYPGHVIVTMRTKIEYVVERNDQGKMEPRRISLKPEQRDGVEYDFDVAFDLDNAGTVMRVSKTRCPELAGRTFTYPTAEVGDTIQSWLDRAAVGELVNPATVREWALDETRTIEELRDRHLQLDAVGQTEAVVYDITGENLIGVGTLLQSRARDIRAAAQRAAAVAERRSRLAEAK